MLDNIDNNHSLFFHRVEFAQLHQYIRPNLLHLIHIVNSRVAIL